MKLLFCKKCVSVFSLTLRKEKTCDCGESKGRYVDYTNAEYEGDCVPLGFVNKQFVSALKNQPKEGWGDEFTAFVIPEKCNTMIKK